MFPNLYYFDHTQWKLNFNISLHGFTAEKNLPLMTAGLEVVMVVDIIVFPKKNVAAASFFWSAVFSVRL